MSGPGVPFVRRSVWSLEATDAWDAVTSGYADAVAAMQARPVTDPTSWAFQAAIHGSYSPPPPGAAWNQCQHASWFFFPWHRMYVYYFEQIVRQAVVAAGGPADWALPYWNYTAPGPANTLPPAFRQQTRQVNGQPQPNPLYTTHRAPGVNQGAGLPARQTSYAYAFGFTNFTGLPTPSFGGGQAPPTHFSHFTGALENQPHNVVHDLLGGATVGQCQGGWMSDPTCAAQDPIFWLHHTNIDRLWTNWLAQHGGRANPTTQRWLTQKFTFYGADGKPVTMTAADVLDTVTQLDYKYDDQPPRVAQQLRVRAAMTSTSPPPPAGPPRLVAATDQAVSLSGNRTSVPLPLPAAARGAVESLAAAQTPASHLVLNVEGIQAPDHPGGVYEVHLNLPSDADPATDDSFFVGTISFFGTGHHDPGEQPETGPGVSHSFDISGLVDTLRSEGRWDPSTATVTFVAVGLTPPPGDTGTQYDITPASAPTIARVSLVSM